MGMLWCAGLLGAAVLAAVLAIFSLPAEARPGSVGFAPDRLLVKVEEGAPRGTLDTVNRRTGASVEEKVPQTGVSVIDPPAGLSVPEAERLYEASPGIEYAEPDYELRPAGTPNDPGYPQLWGMNNVGQSGGTLDADIDAPSAWDAAAGAEKTVVAVIDTGISIGHPDLRDNVWTNPGEVAGNEKDDDANGYVDDVHGWDFYHEDSTVYDSATDDRHGTHVAGTIAAEAGNGAGVAGVGRATEVMPLKFIGPGDKGYVSDAVQALEYAVREGVKISNNSYGFYDTCDGCYARTLRDAIQRADAADHLFVAAAMNGYTDGIGDDNDVSPAYPAGYDLPNIVSVAASDRDDNLTRFSNYGSETVDLAAPGIDVLSTVPGNSYEFGAGTSMAAPHVAGTAALIEGESPGLDDVGLKARLLDSVDHRSSLEGKVVSGGRLNAARALGVNVGEPQNTSPTITGPRPLKTRDRTPVVTAIVRDAETKRLQGSQIEAYVDGQRVTRLRYSDARDRLVLEPGRLPYSRHQARVVVLDPQGLTTTRSWTFRVSR